MSHDAVLQLRHSAHVRAEPGRLLPIRLSPPAWGAGLLSLEGVATANHKEQRQGEVKGFSFLMVLLCGC